MQRELAHRIQHGFVQRQRQQQRQLDERELVHCCLQPNLKTATNFIGLCHRYCDTYPLAEASAAPETVKMRRMAAASNREEKTVEAKVATEPEMKRYCKEVNISSLPFIEAAVLACLAKKCKRERRDTVKLFARICKCEHKEAYEILMDRGEAYGNAVHTIAVTMQREIRNRELRLPKIRVKEKQDGSSGKVRKISVQHIWQLFYDHVAVLAMQELNKIMGEHQVSGRKGMGGACGQRIIRKWLSAKKRVYFTKLDISRYYDSVNADKLIAWLGKRVKNERLMWLVSTLIKTGEKGLNIGSYLSHFLANLYLSDVWHYAMQKTEGIKHALFYMDDLLLVGSNKRKLKKSICEVIELIKEKWLKVKDGWYIRACEDNRPIDIMGVRFSRKKETLRKRIFRRARRAIIRLARFVRKHAKASVRLARRVVSYNGWISRADCKRFAESMRLRDLLKIAGKIINNQQLKEAA